MSKQSKQYESMRQTQINTFSDGLNMDLHPLTTPNTILTDCVNGTMITYNDNEFVLQNERGNSKIKIGDNDHVKLSKGFIPVGMKEHNGILYIVSHNPQTKESEIGTFPSPVNSEKFVETTWNKALDVQNVIKYSEANSSNIEYYDYNLVVSNYDKYRLEEKNNNPLIILDHYLLSENGKLSEIELQNGEHRFTNTGSGILGYKYRTYYIDTLNAYINPIQNTTNARLFIEIMSTDKKLIENYKNFDFEFCITVDNITNENGESFFNQTIFMTNFSEYNNLQGIVTLPLDFSAILSTEEFIYDNENKVLKHLNGDTYSNLNFKITMTLHKKDHQYSLIMDNHESFINIKVEEVIQPVQIFSIFKYKKSPGLNNSTNLETKIVLDLKKYNINHSVETIYKVEDASYKLYKIDRNGNIEGEALRSNKGLIDYKTYDVLSSHSEFKSKYDLLAANVEGINTYQFVNETNGPRKTVLYSKKEGDTDFCANLPQIENAVKVQYQKVDKYIYNVVLLDASGTVLSTTNVKSSCSEDLIDERWDIDTITYDIKGISYTPNSVYLLELTFPLIIDGEFKNNKASFIVVTTDKMLTNEHYELDRMDLLGVEDWYDANISISDVIIHDAINTQNDTYYNSNILHTVDEINNSDDILKLVERKFLKYQPVLDVTVMKEEIPKLGYSYDFEISFNNEDVVNFDVEISLNNENKINNNIYKDTLFYEYTLNPKNVEPYAQDWERKYVYDDLKDYSFYTQTVKINEAYKLDEYTGWQDIMYSFENPSKKYGKILGTWNSETIPSEDSFLLGEGTIYWRSIGFDANRLQGGCGNAKKRYEGYYTLDDTANRGSTNFGLTLDCGTIQIMKELNLGNYFHYGKVKDFGKKDRVKYNGELEKIWTRCKKNNKYVLVGLNLNQETSEKCKNILDTLLQHMYYLRYDPKTVIQYKFETLVDNEESTNDIVVSEINNLSKTIDISYIITPTQCKIVNNNLSNYNIQSWNNVSTKFIIKNYRKTIKIETPNMEKVRTYLQYLGLLLNVNQISKDEKLSSDNSNPLYYDFDETLLNSDLNSKSISQGKLPQLFYDENRRLTYLDTVIIEKDYFEYIGEKECVPNFNWNYKDTFDFKLTNIDDLLSYHSLQFYKLTSYEPE